MAPRDCLQPDLPHLPLLLHRHSHRARLRRQPRCTWRVRGRLCGGRGWRHKRWRSRRGPALSPTAQEVLRRDVHGPSLPHARGLHHLCPRGSREHVVTAAGRPRDWRPRRLRLPSHDLPQRGRREEAPEQRHIHCDWDLAKLGLRLGSSLRCRSRVR